MTLSEPYDCVYVSPHPRDVVLSCRARLRAEASRGLRILVAVIFDAPGEAELGRGVELRRLGLPQALRRDPRYASPGEAHYARMVGDDALVADLAHQLDRLAHGTQARRLYLPLGVGGHIDHRVSSEAGLRAFEQAGGRDILFYEERPYALVPGAVYLRLAQLAVRLPPAAVAGLRPAALPRFLWSVHSATCEDGGRPGWRERSRCRGLAAREWWRARAWLPHKALGPRLQPLPSSEGERCWLMLPRRDDGPLTREQAEALALTS